MMRCMKAGNEKKKEKSFWQKYFQKIIYRSDQVKSGI